MASRDSKQRKSSVAVNFQRDGNETPERLLRHVHEREPANYGLFAQIIRTILIVAWFTSCCASIVVAQLIGAPLYFINREYFNSYMSMTKRSFGLTITALTQWCSPTPVRVSGDRSVQGQISLSKDGTLQTRFPERMVLIANHQVYTDWLYLWWVAYTNHMHGHIYIILKESLKYIPVIGQGMMLYGFIFMARKWLSDKPRLQHRLEKLQTRRAASTPGSPLYDPMWLLIFPEGTNLSQNTKRISDAYGKKQGIASYNHQILPRVTGLFFCLQNLRGTVDWLYDCTMGYDGPPKGSFPEAYYSLRSTYMECRPPRTVNFYWRRFALSEIPLDDQKEFEAWLFKRWEEKDQLLDQFFETGKFPPFEQGTTLNGRGIDGNDQVATDKETGYIESEIRLVHWVEIIKIFTMLIVGIGTTRLLLRLWS